MTIAILYAESRFTPWSENIDAETVVRAYKALRASYSVSLVHMTEPNPDLTDLLRTYDAVLNLCNGYRSHAQCDIAMWLDEAGIPQIANSGASQVIAQDKRRTESLLHECGLPVVRSVTSPDIHVLSAHVIAKPRCGGCHRNIDVVPTEQLSEHWERWVRMDYLVQPYLTGREFSVAVLPASRGRGFEALEPVEIVPVPRRDVFIAGQSMGRTVREFHPELHASERRILKETAIRAHEMVGFTYSSRVDFRMWNGQVFILDVNAMPNMHPTLSLFPSLLREHGIRLSDFYKRLVRSHVRMRSLPPVSRLAM
jgi:D-alanine-D-alanine ligase